MIIAVVSAPPHGVAMWLDFLSLRHIASVTGLGCMNAVLRKEFNDLHAACAV